MKAPVDPHSLLGFWKWVSNMELSVVKNTHI